jgi:hypothetical protein
MAGDHRILAVTVSVRGIEPANLRRLRDWMRQGSYRFSTALDTIQDLVDDREDSS